MPSDTRIRGKYHILDFPLSADWVDKLLGRIVLSQENPTAQTAPPNDGPNGSSIPQIIVPEIAKERVPYTTLYYLLEDFKDVGQSAKITKYFQEKAQKETSATHSITAINAERIDISNIPDKLEQLWENEIYRKAAEKILWQNGKSLTLWMVTGIYVSNSLTVQVEDTKQTDVAAKVNAPVSEALSDPTGTLDVEMGAQYMKARSKTEEFQIDARSVFAVAYTPVKLQVTSKNNGQKKSKFSFHLHKKQKDAVDYDFKIYIDTSPGAKIFAGSSSDSDSGSEAGSTRSASTEVNAAAAAHLSPAHGEDSEVRSTTSTKVGEPGVVENAPFVFKTSDNVFGNV